MSVQTLLALLIVLLAAAYVGRRAWRMVRPPRGGDGGCGTGCGCGSTAASSQPATTRPSSSTAVDKRSG